MSDQEKMRKIADEVIKDQLRPFDRAVFKSDGFRQKEFTDTIFGTPYYVTQYSAVYELKIDEKNNLSEYICVNCEHTGNQIGRKWYYSEDELGSDEKDVMVDICYLTTPMIKVIKSI